MDLLPFLPLFFLRAYKILKPSIHNLAGLILLQFNWRRGSKACLPRAWVPGVKDTRVRFLKTLSAPLIFFRFLRCLFLVHPIHFFQLNLNPQLIRKQNHKIFISLAFFTRTLESLNPRTLHEHPCSIGDDTLILPELTPTNREMIHLF